MAAINVVLNGTFTTDAGTSTGSFVGQMAYSDRGVGGGPVLPPYYPAHPIAPGGEHPAHPIAPGGPPPHVEHPIVLPDPPPIDPPTEPPTNPPSPNWVWGYVPGGDGKGYWSPVYVPGPNDPAPH